MSRTLNVLLKLNTSDFDKGFIKAQRRIAAFGNNLQSLGQSLSTKITLPLAIIAGAAINASAEFDRLRKGLEVMGGSAEEGARQFAALKEVAKLPGIDFEQAIRGSIRLQSIGLAAKDAENAIAQLSKVTALTGTAENLDQVINQFTQISAKGRILNQDLLVILSNAPELGKVFRETFGGATAEAIRAATSSTDDFIKRTIEAIQNSEKYQKSQDNLSNAIVNFRQALRQSLATIGDAIVNTVDLRSKLNSVSASVDRFATGFNNLNPGVKTAIISILGLAAAIGPLLFGLGSLVKLFPIIRIGFATLTGPVGASITILLLLAAAVAKVGLEFKNAETARKFFSGGSSADAALFGVSIRGKTQDEKRGRSALAFAGVQPTGSQLLNRQPRIGISPLSSLGDLSTSGNLADTNKNLNDTAAALDNVQRAARPLIEIPRLTGSAFGELAEQVDFSNIALLKSTTATDAAASSIEQVRANTAAWQEQVAAGIPLNIEADVLLEKQAERLQKIADVLTGPIQEGFSGFFDTLLSGGQNAFKAFGEAIKGLIKKLLVAVATAFALSLILSAITPGGAGGVLAKLGGGVGGLGGLFKSLLKGQLGFARGGLVTGPVSALIGEGRGTTRANPEVVAPLDKLQQILGNVQQSGYIASTRLDGNDLLILIERAERNRIR